MSQIAELLQENVELKTSNTALTHRIGDLESEIAQLREELRLALFRQFGKSSEKLVGQGELAFEDLEPGETPQDIEKSVVAQHERRRKAGRKRLSDSLPRTEVYHDLADTEKVCALV